jgi:hypothetical protein
MTNHEVYQTALAILGELESDCADYEARMPLLLASIVQTHATMDHRYREANGLSVGWGISAGGAVEPQAEFELSDRFATIAAYELAAKLIGRDNPAFAEQCTKAAQAELDKIVQSEIPASIHLISREEQPS